MNVVFSLVLYRHSFESIKPLIFSLQRLFGCNSRYSFVLSVYNACPHDSDDANPSRLKSILNGCLLLYQYGENIGFGSANNKNFHAFRGDEHFLFVVVNPDISFEPYPMVSLLDWIASRRDVSCVAPLVLNPGDRIQFSAKNNPTLASLVIGKFPSLKRIRLVNSYDRKHRNIDRDYRSTCFKSSYLSGCFLVIPSFYYVIVGGFCEKYFLHLEDADITRRLSRVGKTFHNPIGVVEHKWARGSHHSLIQTIHLLHSICIYFLEWGVKLY